MALSPSPHHIVNPQLLMKNATHTLNSIGAKYVTMQNKIEGKTKSKHASSNERKVKTCWFGSAK
jgi:hypothetical protein